MLDLSFYKNKRVLVTGHTGFKGTWISKILINSGAIVCGYSLEAPTNPNLFSLSKIEKQMKSIIGDIRDYKHLKDVFDEFQPEIVMHLAAQPIVRDSYKNPLYTYETNVIGTANINGGTFNTRRRRCRITSSRSSCSKSSSKINSNSKRFCSNNIWYKFIMYSNIY